MLYLLIAILHILFALIIIRSKGVKRLLYFLLAVFFIPANMRVIPNSLFLGHLLYSTSFLLSLLYHKELTYNRLKYNPLNKPLLCILISCLLIGLLDEFQGPITGMWEGLKYYLKTFFLFYVGWFSLNTYNEKIGNRTARSDYNDSLFYTLLPYTIIITLYGL